MEDQNQNQQAKREIRTFVMFDTETTGLSSPKITELCFVAISREELMTRQQAPRVLNKLLLCFNPMRDIEPRATELSDIHNNDVESMPPFEKQARLLCNFLKNLPQPACLIAHNGDRFDFPLLVSELTTAEEEIPAVFCADSLKALRMLDKLPRVPEFDQGEPSKKVQPLTQTGGTEQSVAAAGNATSGVTFSKPDKSSSNRTKYNLRSVYISTFNEELPDAHTAEGDCLALLKIIQHKSEISYLGVTSMLKPYLC